MHQIVVLCLLFTTLTHHTLAMGDTEKAYHLAPTVAEQTQASTPTGHVVDIPAAAQGIKVEGKNPDSGDGQEPGRGLSTKPSHAPWALHHINLLILVKFLDTPV